MAVTEVVRALGSWSLTLSERTPQHVIDMLAANRFGHIAIDGARDNPAVVGDALLDTARYVGVLRGSSHEAGKVTLSGSGLAFWLGAEDGLGDVFETAVSIAAQPFATAITALLPAGGAVTAGTITTPSGATAYTGSHRYQTSRQAIDYVCDLYECDWVVRGDWTLDAGRPETLFVTDPQAAVIRRAEGVDMGLRALPGAAKLDSDVEDFSTRVVMLAQGEGISIANGIADIAVNPYLDPHGNPIKLTRLVSESNTSMTNADARAELALAQFTTPRESLSVSTTTHDIRGDVSVGDSVWVYDPDAGLYDHDNEITFRGDRISPVKLRVFQISWPVEAGMGVYFRTSAGVWHDLTDYVEWEQGQTNLTVGGYDRPLAATGEPISFRPNLTTGGGDTSIPGVPAFVLPFTQAVYLGNSGLSRGQLTVSWTAPATNTDATAFVDGAHYEIRYRVAPSVSSTWAAVGALTWGELSTWGNLVAVPAGDWSTAFAAIDSGTHLLQELTPGTSYQLQIRAVDTASPPNAGAWSAITTVHVGDDTIAPATPAAPEVSASLVQIGVKHTLGEAAGGTYNLALDLAHLEVHVGSSSGFTVDTRSIADGGTQAGKLIATRTQIAGTIPVIGTFPVAAPGTVWVKVVAVDQAGNRSSASAAASVTATLIDSQWVSSLTADTITAGDFTASYGLLGLFTAGTPGASRFEAGDNGSDPTGFRLYRSSGTKSLVGDATTGDLAFYATNGTSKTLLLEAATGDITMFKSDGTTVALKLTASTGLVDMNGKLTSGSGVGVGATVVVNPSDASLNMYPNSTTRRVRMRPWVGTDPGGASSVPQMWIETLDTTGTAEGPVIATSGTNMWLFHRTGTVVEGAYLYLGGLGQGNGGILGFRDGALDSQVRVYPSGDVGILSDGGNVEISTGGGEFYLNSGGHPLRIQGIMQVDDSLSGYSAMYVGFADSGGTSGIIKNYGVTMQSSRSIFATMFGSAVAVYVSASSLTSFTILRASGGGGIIYYQSIGHNG